MVEALLVADAAAVASAARRLLRARQITHHQHSLLGVLLWGGGLRRHGRATLEASLTRLQDRAALARGTVVAGLHRLAELGLVAVTKRRVRIAWGGAVASRQATSRYSLVPPDTESTGRPVPQGLEILVVEAPAGQQQAAAALAAVRERRAAGRWAVQDGRQGQLVAV